MKAWFIEEFDGSLFEGEINGKRIDNKDTYQMIEHLLEKIEDKFGICYTDEFVEDLEISIYNTRSNYYYWQFSYEDARAEFDSDIEEANSFEELQFDYFGKELRFDRLNQKLANGEYSNKNTNVRTM